MILKIMLIIMMVIPLFVLGVGLLANLMDEVFTKKKDGSKK